MSSGDGGVRSPKRAEKGLTLKARSSPKSQSVAQRVDGGSSGVDGVQVDAAVVMKKTPWGTVERVDLSGGGASADELAKLVAGMRARSLCDLCLASNNVGSLFLKPLSVHGRQLLRLVRLDISHNAVTDLDAVTRLPALQELDATKNIVERIPVSVSRMQCLRTLLLGRNKLKLLTDLERLRQCVHLTDLNIDGNPYSELAHCRLYTVFQLRSLNTLNGDPVTAEERKASAVRFSAEEVSKLKLELCASAGRLAEMASDQDRITRDKAALESRLQQTEMDAALASANAQELAEKEQKLQQSTSELAEANARLTDADMELSYYRIESAYLALITRTSLCIDL